jgi:vacuolar-type H+-ATPase subunit F/Vma7
MEIFCIGESSFCDFFSYIGVPSQICCKSEDAVRCIAGRIGRTARGVEEMILVSETLLEDRNKALESLLNDPSHIIISIPSPTPHTSSSDTGSMMRRLLGAS